MNIQLDQLDTQSNAGGMVDVYNDSGTYVKSFYSVMYCPSCVTIRTIGIHHTRLHHSVAWNNAVPVFLSDSYCKRPKCKPRFRHNNQLSITPEDTNETR